MYVQVFIIFQPGQNYFIHSTRNAYLVYEYDIIYKELFDLARLSFGTLQSLYLLMGWVQLTQPENRIGIFFFVLGIIGDFFFPVYSIANKKNHQNWSTYIWLRVRAVIGNPTDPSLHILVCMCVSKYICSSSVMSLIITHY